MTANYRPILICPHVAATPDDYVAWFTGRGVEFHWACGACALLYPELPEGFIEATDALFEHCLEEGALCEGVCGKPEVKHRPSLLNFSHREISTKFQPTNLIDIQPNVKSCDEWFVLLACGDFAILNSRTAELNTLYRLSKLGFKIDAEAVLCVSFKNDFAACFRASGQHAIVFDLKTGAITARIDRGSYHSENSYFPIAFFEYQQRTLLVAGTDWNRLDIFEPGSGTLLTKRVFGEVKKEKLPDHYLNYFHAQLLVSPKEIGLSTTGGYGIPGGLLDPGI